jgi:uncharacterized membrane protein
MKHSETSAVRQMNQNYSPFRPILAVFLTLAVLQGLHLKGNLTFRKQILMAQEPVSKAMPIAQGISDTVEKVSKDLMQLSDGKTNEAAKIIDEFKIRVNAPPAPPPK